MTISKVSPALSLGEVNVVLSVRVCKIHFSEYI